MKEVKMKSMRQETFYEIIKSKDYLTLFICEFEISGNLFIICMIMDIRYIIFIYKREDLVYGYKKEEMIDSIREFYEAINIKICIGDKLYIGEQIREAGFECNNLNHYENSRILQRNLRTFKEIITKEGIKCENLGEIYNNKIVKTLARRSPTHWLNKLKKSDDFKTKNNLTNEGLIKHVSAVPISRNGGTRGLVKDADLKIGDTSLEDLSNEYVEKIVNTKYSSDWSKFCFYIIVQFKRFSDVLKENCVYLEQSNKYAEETLIQVRESKEIIERDREDIKNRYESIKKQYENLKAQNVYLEKQLNTVCEEIEILKQKRLEQEARVLKRKNAKKQPQRDKMEYAEFCYILDLVKDMNFYNARKRCAFIILYITGLRVSNLLLLKKDHILKLFASGSVRLDLIKRGEREHLITISNKSAELLNDNLDYFTYILKRKNNNEYFFSTIDRGDTPLDRCVFNRELNAILKKASMEFDKNFKTHSFRATFITDLLKEAPIHIAKDIVGHEVVSSTEIYYRSSLTKKDSLKILNSVDTLRFN